MVQLSKTLRSGLTQRSKKLFRAAKMSLEKSFSAELRQKNNK